MDQYYKIADLVVRMNTFGRTLEQAKPYQIAPIEHVDINIVSNWEQRKPEYPHLTDSDGEYLATGGNFSKQLLDFNGLRLHASAVVVDGNAYLFSADSGTGKSTHTSLWLKCFGDRAYILNDDKPALRLIDGRWYAFGTPWSGKNDISVNAGVPVAGIAMIQRGTENSIYPWSGESAIVAVLKQVHRPREASCRIKVLDLLDLMIQQVPIWKLTCNMETEAAIVAYNEMSRGQKTPNKRNNL